MHSNVSQNISEIANVFDELFQLAHYSLTRTFTNVSLY